jgi:hypothetical protein
MHNYTFLRHLQSLPAYDAINMTVTAVSANSADPPVVWTEMYTALMDDPPALTNADIIISPASTGNIYPLGTTITITLNISEALPFDYYRWF